jgi:nicotinamide-nucleotide amidase
MVEGAVQKSGADCAVSVTGVAGPGGGTAAKPVGMVCFGFKVPGRPSTTFTRMLPGDRGAVRDASVEIALLTMTELLKDEGLDVAQRKSSP